MRFEPASVQFTQLTKHTHQFDGLKAGIGRDQDLDPIAGRQDDRLVDARCAGEFIEGSGQFGFRKREPFADARLELSDGSIL